MVEEHTTQENPNELSNRCVTPAFVVLILVCGCCFILGSLLLEERNTDTCPAVPGWFSETDLMGTWIAKGLSDKTTDTLIIRQDGKYKQIIHTEDPTANYESDWQAWRLGRGQKGIPYLYLQNWHVNAACVSLSYDCDWVEDSQIYMMDCCGDRPAQPGPGESVLTILGPPPYRTPTGTRNTDIRILAFMGCESSAWWYTLQEP